jgi:chemosensory pili system protein ChpC
MRRRPNDRSLHALDIPLANLSLLVPSAAIAEIVMPTPITPVPFSPPWLLGVVAWRTLAVPVVSFEALLGGAPGVTTPASKIVMLYPLTGRGQSEFFGIFTTAEPRPRPLGGSDATSAASSELPSSPYLAGGIRLNGQLLAIPNLEALRGLFYPA